MKFNQFSKPNRLIAYMHHNGIMVKPSEDYKDIVKFGITSSLVALQTMLSSLKAKGLVDNDAAGYWYLTNAGKKMGYTLIKALDEGEKIPDCSWPDEDEQPLGLQDKVEVVNLTDIAQKFASIAQQFANSANANDSSLQKIKSLEDELAAKNAKLDEYIAANACLEHQRSELFNKVCELQQQINYLHATLSNNLAVLNEKNKKVEHLENSIEKLVANLKKMSVWALDMKNGAN